MIEIKLNFNYGYKWYIKNDCFVKGYLLDKDKKLLKEDSLIDYFLSINSQNDFEDKLLNSNGIFTVIIKKNNKLFVAVDRTRTFPVFYTKYNNKLYISDDNSYLKSKLNKSFSELSINEFLAAGYVTSKDTLLKDIYQLQAGEYLTYSKNNISTSFYHTYISNNINSNSLEILKEDFLNILENMIKRVITVINGKQVVIPLSGGYDSRLIATLFKKYNYDNVICFTYGSKDSFEVDISKKVANQLGYKWYYIEYNEDIISVNYIESEFFLKYFYYASNFVSQPLLQDYFAIEYLHKNNIIDKEAYIIPGHTGDFISGGHIPLDINKYSLKNIVKYIKKQHYIFTYKINKNILNKLNKEIIFCKNMHLAYENWEFKERQSKFIINANRIYEYFGYKYLIPLWDKELIDFFIKLPLKYKKNYIFYETILLDNIFKEFNIDYKKEKSNQQNKIKELLKRVIPAFLKHKLVKILINRKFNDINRHDIYMKPIFKYMNIPFKYSEVGTIYLQWCLIKLKDGLTKL